jgi:hypothetical protein
MSEANYSAAMHCQCGELLRQPTGRGRKRKHCSQRCRDLACAQPYTTKGVRQFSCGHCAGSFMAERKRKYCSDGCAANAVASIVRRKRQEKNKSDPPISCRNCGAVFCVLPSVPGTSAYCAPCAEARKDTAYSLARRRRIQAARVEPVDRIEVFDRDKWRCQICGIETIRQPYTDKSAELDHVVPLSRGGEHSYANTQCACRRCNSLKGAGFAAMP